MAPARRAEEAVVPAVARARAAERVAERAVGPVERVAAQAGPAQALAPVAQEEPARRARARALLVQEWVVRQPQVVRP